MWRKPALPITDNRHPATPGIPVSILRQRCPRCRRGAIYRCSLFRGWLSMYERCPVCGLRFEREQGYFVGAMYVSYALAIPPYLLLVTGFWLFAGWRYEWALLGAVVAYLPFVPMAMRISRVIWMYIDQAFDPER
jgi:uncharacterized protein (DUF983 family)